MEVTQVLHRHCEKVLSALGVWERAPGIMLGRLVVTQVLHKVCLGREGCPGAVCVVAA